MKRPVLTILILALAVCLSGCGKKQQPISETQEPISMEELSRLDASTQRVPETASATAPVVTVTPSSAVPASEVKLEQLPPSGPYKPTTTEIQTALRNSGFYAGAIDGKRGPQTKKAIMDFQKANGLDADGKVGTKTWAVLGKYLNPEPVPSK
ncbi:MAG: peptidoglycan-binding domain-containing protein, partial [Candidatus Omnitrophota bacterium]